MIPRVLQNFKGYRAVIVTPNRESVLGLVTTAERLGMEVYFPGITNGQADICLSDLARERDVMFLDSDVDFSAIFSGWTIGSFLSIPVIGLVGVEAPGRLKHLIASGATEFLRKPVNGSAVFTALFLGVNQFLIRSSLELKIEEMERRKRGRKWIVKAIVKMMSVRGIGEDEAFTELRRESMRLRMNIEEYCEGLAKIDEKKIATSVKRLR